MPSFTAQVPNLHADGPVIEVGIAVGTAAEGVLRDTKKPIPSPVRTEGLIDTGATSSVIRQGLATDLGLKPVGVTRIHTASATDVPCYEYVVRLLFPNDVVIESTVLEAPLRGQPVQCLIGRDVLAEAVLVYIGNENLFSLSF